MLRRPLLSTDFFFSFQKAVGSDPKAFESYLKLIYSDPLLQHALYLASPALHQQVLQLLNNELQSGKEDLLKTLYKYLIRMSTRCTPFGLFAGYSLGVFAANTRIQFKSENSLELQTRLDAVISRQFVNQILKSPQVISQLKFFPNSSLYKIMDSYRYVERGADGKSLGLSAIKSSQYLVKVLAHAKDGRTKAELHEVLLQDKIGKKTAKAFINSLLESELLVSSFEMNATGEDYLERLENMLRNMTGADEHLMMIANIQMLVKSSSTPAVVQQALKAQFDKAELKAIDKSFLHTDLAFQTSSCQISRSTADILASEIQELSFLASETGNPDLAEFANRLFSNFGNKPVPLLPALDPASGIGYGTLQATVSSNLALLTGLSDPESKETIKKSDTLLSRLQNKILEKTRETDCMAYQISPSDIASFNDEIPTHLPESFYVFGSVISSSESDFKKGEFMFDLKAVAGPSALNLMSRFAQSDTDLKNQLEDAARLEDAHNPDVILAEICHVPSAHVLKVVNRPSLRSYEIPYLSHSSLPKNYQIQACELLVSSPDGKEIILSCKRLNKRIIPRLTSAHYYANGLPFYRFLCELARQSDSANPGWDWGRFVQESFLPRTTYKHLILQKASWRLEWNEFEVVMAQGEDQLLGWAAFADSRKLPRYFQIRQGDNELLIDGQSIFSLRLLEDCLKKSSPLILTEFLETERQGFLTEKNSFLANEIVIPFLNPRQRSARESAVKTKTSQSVFPLGSRWLYVKLYCSEQASDFLLSEIIAPFCDAQLKRNSLVKWFFIRYYDPKPHLRVRFDLNQSGLSWNNFLSAFQRTIKPHLDSGLVSSFVTDQYLREIGRYNHLPYETMETLFFEDSCRVSRSLPFLIEHQDTDLRWLVALKGCDSLLSTAGLTVHEKYALIERLHQVFSAEFNASVDDQIVLNQKYRLHRKRISFILNPENDQVNGMEPFSKHFDAFSKVIRNSFTTGDSTLHDNLILTAAHLMHLFLNRWFNTSHRKQEWIMYHFLKKYYDTVLNLEKTAKK